MANERQDNVKLKVPAISSSNNSQKPKQKTTCRGFVHRLSPAIQGQTRQKSWKDTDSVGKIETSSTRSLFSSQRGSVQLEEELSLGQLKKLMKLFKTHRPHGSQITTSFNLFSTKLRTNGKPGLMNLEDFRKAICKAFQLEDDGLDEQMEELFKKVDISSDGLVDWDELSSYILLRLREKDVMRSSSERKVFYQPPKIVKMERNKESTSRILTVRNPTRYITISKDGIIRVWNTKLVLQRTLMMKNGDHSMIQLSSTKRLMKMWVTDAVVMENVHKMAVCTTNMDMYFYDMSTPVYILQFRLCGLGAVAFCMDYHYNKKNLSEKSLLFYGDDKGCVNILVFLMPLNGLFETPFKKNGGTHTVFLQDLSSHSNHVTHITDQVHSDWVRKLQYYSSSDILMSCSGNGKDTLVVRNVLKKVHEKSYIYRVSKGIDCFDYSKERNTIVTGGMDHLVRLWNPYVTIKPVAILRGHIARVLDVVIHGEMGKVFSYDSDTVLKTWDIKEHHCIQSIHLKYPYDPHHLEHGPFPVVLLPTPANSLLIACEDYLTELRLHDHAESKNQQTSHERPIITALYNATKNQVITGCESSVVRTWNVETGRKVFEFLGVHDKDEISCMALENSGRRLFTGSLSGMVYIWAAGNGQLLHKCLPEPDYECEVTAIQPLPEKSYTLAVGWSRRIIMYHDNSEMLSVPADPSWKGGHVHEDDILCIGHCSPNLLATGSFDGDMILWSLERQNIFKRLKRGSGSLFKSKIKKVGLTSKRRLKKENKHSIPIDTLLFLEKRAHIKEQDSAILVSSQAGVLEFWSMFGPLRPRGSFYAPFRPGCTVLSLATNKDNNILVSGDSSGYIAVWNIEEYCTMRLDASVAKVWVSPKRQPSADQNDGPPPQQDIWQGHTTAVVSLQAINHLQRGILILSASTDCTAKLWTVNGERIGMFGQSPAWDLKCVNSVPSLTKNELNEDDSLLSALKKTEHEKSSPELQKNNDSHDKGPTWNTARPQTTGEVIRPTLQTFLEKNVTTSSSKSTRDSEISGLERSSTEWSILGDRYNKSFERRMVDRRNRRGNLGHVDANLTRGGGLESLCSPFQALQTLTTNEFELPRDLPMTPRMVSRSKLSSEETWQKNLVSLNLPPILLEDNNST